MIWRTIYYDFPFAALLLLFTVPIAACLYFLYQERKKKLQAFAAPHVLETVLEKRQLFWTKALLYCLAWICGVIALMQPKGNERYASASAVNIPSTFSDRPDITLRRKAHEVILLIDASSSMNIADVSERTRLEAGKAIADDLISRLQGENVSLFAFTGSAIQIVPSTLDYLFTRLMLRQIQINEGETDGTNIKFALDYVKKLYFEKPSPITKTVIVFSDGGDTRLTGLDSNQTKQAIQEIIAPVADAEENNLYVFTVGIGSSQGAQVPGVSFQGHPVPSSLEEPLLRKLAIAGRGDLFILGQMTSLQIARKLAQNIAKNESYIDTTKQDSQGQQDNTHLYDLYFQIPLGIAILALGGCLFLPDTRRRRPTFLSLLLLLGSTAFLEAQDPTQLARAYFEAGDYPQARREYEWLLDDSIPQWQQDILQYNIGTALLAQGSWEEAIPHLQLITNTSLPALKQRAAANLAAARLMQLQNQLNSLPNDAPVSIQLFLLFRQALYDIEKAHTAWCELEMLEGAQTCPSSINAEYDKTRQYLQSVMRSLTEFRPMKVRIQDAISYLYDSNESSTPKSPPAPKKQLPAAFLENLIAQEEFLLLLYQLQEEVSPQSEEANQEWGDISLSHLQQLTASKALDFPKAVLSHQQAVFSRPEAEGRCQCHPWDEVIPLFYSGYQEALKASAQANQESNHTQQGPNVEESIKKAVVSWKEALARMRSPSSKSEQPESKPQEPQPASESPGEPQNTKLYDLLRTLQDMEQDDKSKPIFKSAASGEEERPW